MHKRGYLPAQIRKYRLVSLDKLHEWRNEGTKPYAVKALELAKRRGYFRTFGSNYLETLAYLVGYNLGDGNISRKLCNTWFYGVNTDLEAMKPLFPKFDVKPVVYTYKINNGKMAVHDVAFSRFLVCLGAVVGDKTMARIEVPKWILKSGHGSIFKRRFLQGLFDSELSNVTIITGKVNAYQSLKFYTSKHKNNVKDGIFFLNQIKQLMHEFDVFSTEIKLDRVYYRKRDRSIMQQLYFIVYSNSINLCNFIKNIGFLYNSKRRTSSMKALIKLKEKAKEELYHIHSYKEALALRKCGLSAHRIAAKLRVKPHIVGNWVYYKRKPRLYNFFNNF